MKANELRGKNPDELKQELTTLLREQFNLRMRKGNEQFKRFSQFKAVRRDIARIKTVLAEKGVRV